MYDLGLTGPNMAASSIGRHSPPKTLKKSYSKIIRMRHYNLNYLLKQSRNDSINPLNIVDKKLRNEKNQTQITK